MTSTGSADGLMAALAHLLTTGSSASVKAGG